MFTLFSPYDKGDSVNPEVYRRLIYVAANYPYSGANSSSKEAPWGGNAILIDDYCSKSGASWRRTWVRAKTGIRGLLAAANGLFSSIDGVIGFQCKSLNATIVTLIVRPDRKGLRGDRRKKVFQIMQGLGIFLEVVKAESYLVKSRLVSSGDQSTWVVEYAPFIVWQGEEMQVAEWRSVSEGSNTGHLSSVGLPDSPVLPTVEPGEIGKSIIPSLDGKGYVGVEFLRVDRYPHADAGLFAGVDLHRLKLNIHAEEELYQIANLIWYGSFPWKNTPEMQQAFTDRCKELEASAKKPTVKSKSFTEEGAIEIFLSDGRRLDDTAFKITKVEVSEWLQSKQIYFEIQLPEGIFERETTLILREKYYSWYTREFVGLVLSKYGQLAQAQA